MTVGISIPISYRTRRTDILVCQYVGDRQKCLKGHDRQECLLEQRQAEMSEGTRQAGMPVGTATGRNACPPEGIANMSTATQNIVNKAWNFAHVLRDDGLSYMAYTEQITFLLFLKMADELTKPPHNKKPIVPPSLGWPSLLKFDGDELEAHYRHILEELGKKPGMLGEIFKKARPEIQNPATLKRLIVDLIDTEQWSSMQADVKGDIYEGLLAKSAAESPKGAGQYFTPRELIKRDKVNLDIFWLKDKSLEDSNDLPDPDVLAQEIVDDMQTALDQFSAVVEGLRG